MKPMMNQRIARMTRIPTKMMMRIITITAILATVMIIMMVIM